MQNTAEKNHEKSLCIPCEFCMLNQTRTQDEGGSGCFSQIRIAGHMRRRSTSALTISMAGRKSTEGGKKRLTKASGDAGSIQIPCKFSWEVYRL